MPNWPEIIENQFRQYKTSHPQSLQHHHEPNDHPSLSRRSLKIVARGLEKENKVAA
jgi:hypothetical protein